MSIIDRRRNSGDKNLSNRERFKKRMHETIKKRVREAISKRSITDNSGGSITIDKGGVSEPGIRRDGSGNHEHIVPGNTSNSRGDTFDKSKGGKGGRGRSGAKDGESEDDFTFLLSSKEYLEYVFDELELPFWLKKNLLEGKNDAPVRAGYSTTGSPSNLAVIKTKIKAMSRCIALGRPSLEDVEDAQNKLQQLIEEDGSIEEVKAQREIVRELVRKHQRTPYIDPIDVRYRRFETHPKPISKAVVFPIMDVSASMGEREKELAKRFFLLLYVFLKKKYDHIKVVFIRHTHEAEEVDEQTFFYATQSGGTVCSSAIKLAVDIVKKHYPVADYNIYVAQASDGDNSYDDDDEFSTALKELTSLAQYYAYLEIKDVQASNGYTFMGGSTDDETKVWKVVQELSKNTKNVAFGRANSPGEVFKVFCDLFRKRSVSGG